MIIVIAAGAIIAYGLWDRSVKPTDRSHLASDADRQDIALRHAISELGAIVQRLETALDRHRAPTTAIVTKPYKENGREGVHGSKQPQQNAGAKAIDAAWVNVLDRRVALCLLEHGKTPFDAGVPALIRFVGGRLRAATQHYVEALRTVRSTYSHEGKKLPGFKNEMVEVQRKLNQQRRDALAEFSTALSKL